jgi:hypothetical protein
MPAAWHCSRSPITPKRLGRSFAGDAMPRVMPALFGRIRRQAALADGPGAGGQLARPKVVERDGVGWAPSNDNPEVTKTRSWAAHERVTVKRPG